MADLSEQKAESRKQAFARRKAVHDAARSQLVVQQLLDHLAPMRGRVISAYMPIRTEVDILPAMHALSAHATIAVPVIPGLDQKLDFHRWTPKMAMIPGPFGAQVPAEHEVVVPDIVLLPMLAFDAAGNRLGYGGGFYDRTLEDLRRAGDVLAIGIAYDAQEAAKLPVEATDQRLDGVVTEAGYRAF
ncbi:MAG: 5-formyltetrahydrofolate cyclo-ligase [Marinosulfonomonas sp.]